MTKTHNLLMTTLMVWSCLSFAESLPNKLVMPTDVGKIVITTMPCGINYGAQKVPFLFHAYATELTQGMEIIHQGCWFREDLAVQIHFPEIDAVATYHASYFKPEELY